MPDAQADRNALVLAAGRGTRFHSDRAQVLHRLCGVPLIDHVLENLKAAGVQKTLVVVGHRADSVKAALAERPGVEFIEQKTREAVWLLRRT